MAGDYKILDIESAEWTLMVLAAEARTRREVWLKSVKWFIFAGLGLFWTNIPLNIQNRLEV